ncbi:thiamine pyrophosphate-dependent enzyme [Amycolatopsis sp. WQ 127309]|uniref:thiamine pyrophosphate-dependent enzyme n=1 Tax=Amycolatopsis sp. WQ 127309 TaxID=2932773 RepID=UPI001FF443BE|nr:thiamine pyrophosphate-dependent enzyme [Amycolatopsis sp. WQ 127309]UOZ06124.1 thiamine pyrophosphate-binding protein [Amycolatopsis sp. WQ 127309]
MVPPTDDAQEAVPMPMSPPSPTAADLIVGGLRAHGVDTVFGLPGVQTYDLFDSLARTGGIRVIGARHEQTVAYMAFGYAQATGRTGVYTVVPGPGVLNASAAMLSAHGASAPVLCLTSEIPRAYLGRGLGHLHEMPDQLATLRTITKWSALVEHPAEVPDALATAFREAAGGRPRPVSLAVPWDVLGLRAPAEVAGPLPLPRPAVDPDAIAAAAELLAGAKNPMIMVGGGARHAAAAVRALAERLQAPVVPFRGGRGIVGDDHPLGFTCVSGFERWPETDVVIGIGSRMELSWFRWPEKPAGLKTILLDIDPRQATRLEADVAIVADAGDAAAALAAAVGPQRTDRTAEFTELKANTAERFSDVGPELEYLRAIRDVLPRDGFFVEEICQVGFASYFGFEVYTPRTFVTCGHQGTLGFGYPTALGVQAAFPGRPVVSVAGDGGFMFAAQELATAVQYGLNVVAVVFDNGYYGNVHLDQERLFEGRALGGRLHNPDFARLAETFGALGLTARTPDELRGALDKAFASGRPALVHVPCELGTGASPWKYLMPKSDRS